MLWIVQQQDIVPAGRYETLLHQHGRARQTSLLHRGDPLPEVHPGDGVIVLGGTMGAYENETYSWLAPLKAWLKEMAVQNTPVLAICLGAQLLADALGATVSANRHGERGICRVHLEDAGVQDPLFAGIPRAFHVLQWHNDSFDLPPGATLLATSQGCPVQAFRYRNAYAVQFHPEVDGGVVSQWNSRLRPPGQYVIEFESARGDWQPAWDRLFMNFLDTHSL